MNVSEQIAIITKRVSFIHSIIFLNLCMIVLLSFSLNSEVSAQEWMYSARPGDNLWNISEKYLKKGTRYTTRLQKLNGIQEPTKIPPGTRIRIPIKWLKYQPVPAIVLETQGKCEGISSAKGRHELTPGQQLYTGDSVSTGKNSSMTLQFADGSKLLVQSETEIVLDTVSAYAKTGMVDTRLRLRRGYVDTGVKPKKGPGSRYEISTPSAVAAVRGTEFRVSAEAGSDLMRSEVIEGRVRVKSHGVNRTVKSGFGVYVKPGKTPSKVIKLLPPPDISGLPERLQYFPLRYSWPRLADASQYRVQVAPSALFNKLLVDQISFQPNVDLSHLADGEYALRLRGIDDFGLEGFNAVHPFTVDARPEAPMPLNPKNNGNIYEPMSRFWWSKPEGISRFRFQLASDSEFNRLLADKPNLDESEFIPEQPLAIGQYFWRVSSLDETGDEGPFTPVQTVNLKEKPAAPEGSEAGIGETEINFQWRGEPDAVKYKFQLSDDSDFEELMVDEYVSDTSYALPMEELSGTYYFRVSAVNADNVSGPFSKTQELEVPSETSPFWYFLLLLLLIPILV